MIAVSETGRNIHSTCFPTIGCHAVEVVTEIDDMRIVTVPHSRTEYCADVWIEDEAITSAYGHTAIQAMMKAYRAALRYREAFL